MRVINLLPWRERQFKEQRRRFIRVSLIITAAATVWCVADYREARRHHRQHQHTVQALSATLLELEAAQTALGQVMADGLAESQRLLQLQRQWRQQQDWWQLMDEWQTLAGETRIADISWRDGELIVRGVSSELDALRSLIHRSPQWQLQHIELDASHHFRFTLLRAELLTELGAFPAPGES